PTVLEAGDLRLHPPTHRGRRGGTDISLSSKEVALLEAVMRRPGGGLDRFTPLGAAWSRDSEDPSHVVDRYVGYLREKVDRPFGAVSIETVRGAGYRLRADGGRT